MTDDDQELERRLRAALTRPRPADRVDTDVFLQRVHRGARVRRIKRGAGVAAVAVLMVAGGGAATNAGGFLDPPTTPSADRGDTGLTLPPSRSDTRPPTGSTPPSTDPTTSSPGIPPASGVTITPGSALTAAEVQPLSITATGTDHQWVLAATPGRDCGRLSCATVLSTADHGDSWTNLGQLPAPPSAPTDEPIAESVNELRIAKRTDDSEQYDGWAFGLSLWSTHDGGRSWSAAGSPPGQVTALESWGGNTYAAISSPVEGDDTATLYRTPSSIDDWQPVPMDVELGSVSALAAANGVVGLIDAGGLRSVLYVSADGTTWTRQDACPAGAAPTALSTAYDAVAGVGGLWVTCTSSAGAMLRYTDTTALGTWHDVDGGDLSVDIVVAAQSPTTALVAGGNVAGIERVSAAAPPVTVSGADVDPLYFGFTNVSHGYLLSTDGSILATENGGGAWAPYAVTDTP